MKRFHVHVSVPDIAASVRFYSNLFGAEPNVLKDDYAKWMLDDPRINFAISNKGREPGVDHLGFQVEDDAELEEVATRLKSADEAVLEQAATTCCYAESKKAWTTDPVGIPWETFLTTGESTVYGGSQICETPRLAKGRKALEIKSCCAP
jgi:catechol 2,3-dioxygenase-like lactoylglutathione lyase family enzyme